MSDIELPLDDPQFLEASLDGLRLHKRRIEVQIRAVEQRLRELRGGNGNPPEHTPKARLSEAARQRISDAQKRRWAAYRSGNSRSASASGALAELPGPLPSPEPGRKKRDFEAGSPATPQEENQVPASGPG